MLNIFVPQIVAALFSCLLLLFVLFFSLLFAARITNMYTHAYTHAHAQIHLTPTLANFELGTRLNQIVNRPLPIHTNIYFLHNF